jgi:hypothetical protein
MRRFAERSNFDPPSAAAVSCQSSALGRVFLAKTCARSYSTGTTGDVFGMFEQLSIGDKSIGKNGHMPPVFWLC